MENTKAMIIMDMPKRCYGCDFCQFDGTPNGRVCTRTGVYVQKDGFNITKSRHETCPLKHIPDKLEISWFSSEQTISNMQKEDAPVYITGYQKGWNDCLNRIQEEE